MLKQDTDNFDFDDSYQDNYENAGVEGVDGTPFDAANNLFDGNTDNLFGDANNDLFGEQPINNPQIPNGMYQQPQAQQNWQQQPNMQQQAWQQNQQRMYQQGQQGQMPQGNVMLDNIRKQAGKVVEDGGVHLTNKHIAFLVFGLGLIALILVMSLHSCATSPKKQSVAQPVQNTQASQSNSKFNANTSKKSNSNTVDTLNLIIVDDKVPIDYTSAFIEATGLVTSKQTYVIDNQVVYCLDISMTVGSETKQVRHFCNRKVYDAITNGTVVNVKFQQVDEHNVAVYDVTTQ